MALTKATYSMISGAPVNVLDYGVVADGTTDNTTALTAALNSGQSVYHPGGVIAISSPVVITSGLSPSFIGASANLCEIKAIGSLATSYQSMIKWTSASNFSIENITFNKDNSVAPTTSPSAYESCVLLKQCTNIKINNNIFKNFKSMGVIAQSPTKIWFTKNIFTNNYPTIYQNEGIFVTSDDGLTSDCYIDQNTFEGTGMDIEIERFYITNNLISDWKFGGGITTEGATGAIYGQICNNIIYDSGLAADENASFCAGIENTATFTTITGNQVYKCASAGISQAGQACIVSNNICANNGLSIGWPGIMLRYYGPAGYQNANGTVLIGNICTDTQTPKTQAFGIQTQTNDVERLVLGPNSLTGNLTAPESLTYPYNTHYVADINAVSDSQTPGTIANGTVFSFGFVINGTALTDLCIASCSVDLQGMSISAAITSGSTVTITVSNNTGSSKTLGACVFYVKAIKRLNFVDY